MLHNILIYMKEIHIHNILSKVLYILVWFFSTTVTCSCSLPPSSFHDPFSVFFCPDLCLSGVTSRAALLRSPCHLATSWIQPISGNHWSQADGKGWRLGIYHPEPRPMLPSCLGTGLTATVVPCHLGSHQTTFPPQPQFPWCFGNILPAPSPSDFRVAVTPPLWLYLSRFLNPASLL